MENQSVQDYIRQKKDSKKELFRQLSVRGKKPLLGVFIEKDMNAKNGQLLQQIIEGLENVNIEVVILSDHATGFQLGQNVKCLEYNRKNRKLLLEAADMALTFSFSDVDEMLLHGTIPISPMRPEVSDYDPNNETGNAFIYRKANPWSIFAALVRAAETYKFTYDWKHIVRSGVESVCNRD